MKSENVLFSYDTESPRSNPHRQCTAGRNYSSDAWDHSSWPHSDHSGSGHTCPWVSKSYSSSQCHRNSRAWDGRRRSGQYAELPVCLSSVSIHRKQRRLRVTIRKLKRRRRAESGICFSSSAFWDEASALMWFRDDLILCSFSVDWGTFLPFHFAKSAHSAFSEIKRRKLYNLNQNVVARSRIP